MSGGGTATAHSASTSVLTRASSSRDTIASLELYLPMSLVVLLLVFATTAGL